MTHWVGNPCFACYNRRFFAARNLRDELRPFTTFRQNDLTQEVICVVKLRLRDNESVQDAVKRFRKLVEHSGIKKEMRRREYYEKPSETKRRARRRAERRDKMNTR